MKHIIFAFFRKIIISFLLQFNKYVHILLNKSYSALCLLKVSPDNAYNSFKLSQVDVIPKGMYECLPKDTCIFGPSDQYLLVKKNRYRVSLLPGQDVSSELGVGWITESNTSQAYDLLWGNETNLEKFRNECHGIRDTLTAEIVSSVSSQPTNPTSSTSLPSSTTSSSASSTVPSSSSASFEFHRDAMYAQCIFS